MDAPALSVEPLVFALRPGRGVIALHATGFRHPRSGRSGAERFTAYADLTHLALGRRTLRIGTRSGLFLVARKLFASPDAPEALVRALIERVVNEPAGALQLARMAEVEETARQPGSQRATRVLVFACLAAFGLQNWLGPGVHHAAFFSAVLATRGEPWRLVTANLLHAGPMHLAFNVLGLLVLGGLLERTIGSMRTALVAGLAALGATFAGLLVGYDAMVGASGIVAGFAGALLWLELRMPERLPAQWRIPRRPFIAALLGRRGAAAARARRSPAPRTSVVSRRVRSRPRSSPVRTCAATRCGRPRRSPSHWCSRSRLRRSEAPRDCCWAAPRGRHTRSVCSRSTTHRS